ncbi:reverse transcriptase domain-containing protein [Tanacetum coccineum]
MGIRALGVDVNEEEHRPNRRDQRDLEIAAQGRRIRELERMLAHARLENFRDVKRGDEGIDIPDFEGKSHPDEFIDWLYTVERVFDIKNLSDEQKVKLVAIKLKKNASIWWEHVIKQRNRKGKPKIVSWEKMKKKLMAKFLPAQYRQEAFIEYHNFKQSGGMLVEEFTNEFDRLRKKKKPLLVIWQA